MGIGIPNNQSSMPFMSFTPPDSNVAIGAPVPDEVIYIERLKPGDFP